MHTPYGLVSHKFPVVVVRESVDHRAQRLVLRRWALLSQMSVVAVVSCHEHWIGLLLLRSPSWKVVCWCRTNFPTKKCDRTHVATLSGSSRPFAVVYAAETCAPGGTCRKLCTSLEQSGSCAVAPIRTCGIQLSSFQSGGLTSHRVRQLRRKAHLPPNGL